MSAKTAPDLSAMTVADISVLATKSNGTGGRPVTDEMIRGDIADGAPTNPDGTINVLHYTAWLSNQWKK